MYKDKKNGIELENELVKVIDPKVAVQFAQNILEQAITCIFAKNNNKCMGAANIGKQGGFFRQGASTQMNDAIVTGLLNKLLEAGIVEHCDQTNNRNGWKLKDKEKN